MIKVNLEINHKLWFREIDSPQKYLNKKIKKILKSIKFYNKKNITFTILLTNSFNIKKLNKKFRNIHKKTDVLSFPYFKNIKLKLKKEKNIYIGDIAVCYEVIKIRSRKTNFLEEFNKTWIHGLLHLFGYNHVKNKDYLVMNKLEKKIINLIQ